LAANPLPVGQAMDKPPKHQAPSRIMPNPKRFSNFDTSLHWLIFVIPLDEGPEN
jgi:hypothetical protein